jgi:hypothetical protein
MEQTTEMIEGVLSESPQRQDSKRYPVNVEVIKKSFKTEGGLITYDFRVANTTNVPVGNYFMEVKVDGEKHGTDVRVVNDLAFSTEIRWSGHSPLDS